VRHLVGRDPEGPHLEDVAVRDLREGVGLGHDVAAALGHEQRGPSAPCPQVPLSQLPLCPSSILLPEIFNLPLKAYNCLESLIL
jgi:hypothetical protein